jgi:hypothetical protein
VKDTNEYGRGIEQRSAIKRSIGPENPFGLDRRDVMLRMVDDDLWIMPTELHYEFEEA